jgi:hypothetical protein
MQCWILCLLHWNASPSAAYSFLLRQRGHAAGPAGGSPTLTVTLDLNLGLARRLSTRGLKPDSTGRVCPIQIEDQARRFKSR